MSNRKTWVVELIARIVPGKPAERVQTAELIVERLMEENLLHLGYGNADIDIVVDTFADSFGTTKTSRQDRWAANRLVSKYGSQAVVGIVKLLAQAPDEKYKPVANSVAQLEEKFPSVLNFLRKTQEDDLEEIQI